MKFIDSTTEFFKRNKLIIVAFISILLLLLMALVILLYMKKNRQVSRSYNSEELANNLTDCIIHWTENYSSQDIFLNEKYDKFIRNVCLNSEFCTRLFDNHEVVEEKYETRKKEFILYGDMKFRSHYADLQKRLGISKDELRSYIFDYTKKKQEDAMIFLNRAKRIDRFRYSNIEKLLDNYRRMDVHTNKFYDFLFSQMVAVDTKFKESFEKIDQNEISREERRNGMGSIITIEKILKKNLINKNELQGIVNDFYRKADKIIDEITDKILLWMSKKSKKFLENDNYDVIFTSLIFKIALVNGESMLFECIESFKKNPEKSLLEIMKSKKINKLELNELVLEFVMNNVQEANYFSILLDEKTQLKDHTDLLKKNTFSISDIDLSKFPRKKSEVNAFVANTFNNDKI